MKYKKIQNLLNNITKIINTVFFFTFCVVTLFLVLYCITCLGLQIGAIRVLLISFKIFNLFKIELFYFFHLKFKPQTKWLLAATPLTLTNSTIPNLSPERKAQEIADFKADVIKKTKKLEISAEGWGYNEDYTKGISEGFSSISKNFINDFEKAENVNFMDAHRLYRNIEKTHLRALCMIQELIDGII